jgi:hypothetical protein
LGSYDFHAPMDGNRFGFQRMDDKVKDGNRFGVVYDFIFPLAILYIKGV